MISKRISFKIANKVERKLLEIKFNEATKKILNRICMLHLMLQSKQKFRAKKQMFGLLNLKK